MTIILRKTKVISVSLPQDIAFVLEKYRKKRGQTRSSFITSLIDKEVENERWEKIFKRGKEIGKKFNITSEDDIDRILHEP